MRKRKRVSKLGALKAEILLVREQLDKERRRRGQMVAREVEGNRQYMQDRLDSRDVMINMLLNALPDAAIAIARSSLKDNRVPLEITEKATHKK